MPDSDGALEDGALEDGALEDGALEDGALEDRALEDRALEDRAVEVRPDPSCMHGLSWALHFPALTAAQLCAALLEMGFQDRTHVDVVREFESERRERIVVIPKTGRVQLRLPLEVPRDERGPRALALAQWVSVSTGRSSR